MQTNNPRTIEISIPSELGYEKVAMVSVETIALKMGFPRERINDLKTAIAEACTNAMEHGNSFLSNLKVLIMLTVFSNHVQISIIDNGHKSVPPTPPDRSKRTDFRGMGMFLITNLVDEVEFQSKKEQNEIKISMYTDRTNETNFQIPS